MDWTVVVIVLFASAFASLLIAQGRGVSGKWIWFAIGFLLGPIGVAFAWFAATPPKTRTPPAE